MPAARDAARAAPGWQQALAEWARAQLDAGVGDLHGIARRDFDAVLLQAALAHSDGHRGDAAHKLGLGRNTLTRKLGPSRKRR
jgi:two-component system nitrogen regulation response regulator GlnG